MEGYKEVLKGSPLEGYAKILKANPYHDALGRFSTANGARFVSLWAKAGNPSLDRIPAKDTKREFKELGDDSKEYFAFKQEMAKQLTKNLTPLEKKAQLDYTGEEFGGFRDTNMMLRHGEDSKSWSAPQKAKVKRNIALLESAIEKNTLGQDVLGFRGVQGAAAARMVNAVKDGNIVGSVLQDKGFVSASVSRDVGTLWASNVMLEMKVPKEQKALYVESNSHFDNEKEFILPPNTMMMVTGFKKPGNSGGPYIVQVDVLPSTPKKIA